MFLFADGVALVVLLFAFGDAEFDFGATVFEVNGEGDEGDAALFAFDFQLVNLAAVGEELTITARLVVVDDGGFGIGIDVTIVEDELTAGDGGVGFLELGFAVAEGFDFGAEEGDAALELVGDEIIVEGPAVVDPRREIVRSLGHL